MLLFCILVCVGTAYLENIFENKSTEAASKVYQDYGKNQFDVIFLGSSAMKNAVYPMQLYKEYGIASYNLGAGSQSTATGYYLAKEAIREHSPQVLVVDCLFTAYDKAYLSDEHLHYVTDMMSVREKWQLVSDLVEPEKYLQALREFNVYWHL